MALSEIALWASGLLTVVANGQGVKDVLKGNATPNRNSLLVWILAPLMATAAGLIGGVEPAKLLPTLIPAFGPAAHFGATLWRGWKDRVSAFGPKSNPLSAWAGLATSLVASAYSVYNPTPGGLALGLAGAILADRIASQGSLDQARDEPDREPGLSYVIGAAGAGVGLLATGFSPYAMAIPAYVLWLESTLARRAFRDPLQRAEALALVQHPLSREKRKKAVKDRLNLLAEFPPPSESALSLFNGVVVTQETEWETRRLVLDLCEHVNNSYGKVLEILRREGNLIPESLEEKIRNRRSPATGLHLPYTEYRYPRDSLRPLWEELKKGCKPEDHDELLHFAANTEPSDDWVRTQKATLRLDLNQPLYEDGPPTPDIDDAEEAKIAELLRERAASAWEAYKWATPPSPTLGPDQLDDPEARASALARYRDWKKSQRFPARRRGQRAGRTDRTDRDPGEERGRFRERFRKRPRG